jgi:hypothetical protein
MRTPLVTGLCLLTAVGSVVGHYVGEDLTGDRMPAAPWWVVLCGALAGVGWTIWVQRRPAHPAQVTVGGAAVLAMLAGSLVLIPHNLLYAIIWVLQLVNPGHNAFPSTPGVEIVPRMIGHLLAVAASAALAYATLRVWRAVRGRCSACGRTTPEPKPVPNGWLVGFGLLSVLGCLPYGLLKLAWSFGSRVGMTGHQFDGVGFDSPGFGDTAVLTSVSIVASVCMLLRLRGRWLRPLLTFVGGVGTVMLLPVGVLGAARTAAELLGIVPSNVTELAPWVFYTVYVGFFVWGIGLCALTIVYVRGTAGPCRQPAAAHDSLDQNAGQNRSSSASMVRSSGSESPTTL